MPRIETYASDDWLQTITLVREGEEDERCRDAALELVAATSALCNDWIFPLAMSWRLESRNPEDYYFADDAHPPARWSWFLRLPEIDDRVYVSEDWIDSSERRVEAIGEAELRSFIMEGLDQPPPAATLEIALSSLTVNALGVALPEGVVLEPRYGGEIIRPLLVNDGQRSLVLCPTYFAATTPMRLRSSDGLGTSRLSLELCWDFWTKHPIGLAQVQSAVERVLARGRGWQLDNGELP